MYLILIAPSRSDSMTACLQVTRGILDDRSSRKDCGYPPPPRKQRDEGDEGDGPDESQPVWRVSSSPGVLHSPRHSPPRKSGASSIRELGGRYLLTWVE